MRRDLKLVWEMFFLFVYPELRIRVREGNMEPFHQKFV